jgi:hypothetical protein
VARTRTTKKLAQRIDLNYFKRSTPLKRAKLWLSVALPALAAVWIGWLGVARDSHVYSSGRLSQAHAVLERQCVACHVPAAAAFSASAKDDACLSCHDGPTHHAGAQASPDCAACHVEHRGAANIRAVKDQACAACHGDLKAPRGASETRFVAQINSFEAGHPEFAAVREGARDTGSIRLNHALHTKRVRSGPNGPTVQLECGDCHRPEQALAAAFATVPEPAGATNHWKYGDARYITTVTSYAAADEVLPVPGGSLVSYRPATGRELMAPVRFATACAGCHSLAFDKRFDEGVPHDKPEVVHAFLVKKFSAYIAAHPQELRETREPGRDLTGRPVQAAVHVYTPNEWVAARLHEAEELLWRKTCKQCHALTFGLRQDTLPTIEPARTTVRWMPHAKFDHDAHRGFACASCHQKALSSTETSDVLLPGIATCRTCHAPGPEHADARCSECHTYHDWSQRKEVAPAFILPALQSGGR